MPPYYSNFFFVYLCFFGFALLTLFFFLSKMHCALCQFLSLVRWIVSLHSHCKRTTPGFTCKWTETHIFRRTKICLFGPHKRLDELWHLPKRSGLSEQTNSGPFKANQTVKAPLVCLWTNLFSFTTCLVSSPLYLFWTWKVSLSGMHLFSELAMCHGKGENVGNKIAISVTNHNVFLNLTKYLLANPNQILWKPNPALSKY